MAREDAPVTFDLRQDVLEPDDRGDRRERGEDPPAPLRLGSQIDFVASFLGRRLAYTYDVVEFVPGRRLVMRSPGAPFPMETTYTWEPEAGGTRMTLRNRGEPSGFSAWLAPLMSFMIGRANRKDLALLKRRLESHCP